MSTEAERILDAALGLARQRGWDALHLHEIAAALGIGVADLHRHFRQKDDLAEALFDRADLALLRAGDDAHAASLPVRERLEQVILAWLQALAPHRQLVAEMLRYKLQLDHLHLHALGVMRISRTVQAMREAARLPAAGLRREIEEVALTGIFVTTFACWLRDDSPDATAARRWLVRRLEWAERAASRFPA